MRESVEMAQNSGVLKAPFCQHHDMSVGLDKATADQSSEGPWEILEGYLVEDIIRPIWGKPGRLLAETHQMGMSQHIL
jgi:hypothetical protein